MFPLLDTSPTTSRKGEERVSVWLVLFFLAQIQFDVSKSTKLFDTKHSSEEEEEESPSGNTNQPSSNAVDAYW